MFCILMVYLRARVQGLIGFSPAASQGVAIAEVVINNVIEVQDYLDIYCSKCIYCSQCKVSLSSRRTPESFLYVRSNKHLVWQAEVSNN